MIHSKDRRQVGLFSIPERRLPSAFLAREVIESARFGCTPPGKNGAGPAVTAPSVPGLGVCIPEVRSCTQPCNFRPKPWLCAGCPEWLE